MGCVVNSPEEQASFLNRLLEKVAQNNVPITGSIELTGKCNFHCIQCYNSTSAGNDEELTTTQWKHILDEITDSGTLFLVITGGEPFLRKDFEELYTYAVKKGLITTCFTNGSLVTDEIIQLFTSYPPVDVEITLYGASEKTYKRVTGRDNMFERCIAGITRLKDNNIPVRLKTVLLKSNIEELSQIQEIARKFDVPHRFDGVISPRLNGDCSPVKERLEPEQIVNINLSADKLVQEWKKLNEKTSGTLISDDLYGCGAGVNSFHIDGQGWLKPCLMVNDIKYSLKKGTFTEGWLSKLPEIRKKKIAADSQCRGCDKALFCSYCPATSMLETGSEHKPSPFQCRIGGLMAEKLYGTENEERK